jgi:hypothetical protein
MRMGFSFEADLRKAEQTINTLIAACNRSGGGVYIGSKDGSGFCAKLTAPISITYWIEHQQEGRDK